MRGYLQKVIVGSEVRGDICVLDKFTSPTQQNAVQDIEK